MTHRWTAVSSRTLVSSVLLVVLTGCGGGDAEPGAAPGTSEATSSAGGSLKHRAKSSLPKVGQYLPPQDGGQLEIAGPEGWQTLPRGAFVAGFYKEKANELPRITVDAQPANFANLTNATEQNADELAKQMAAVLSRQSKAVQEPPRPIVLGDTVYARHVRLAKYAGSPAVIQSLQTVKNGRLYSVELFCDVEAPRAEEYEASLTKWRDYGYAVAANLRFLGGDSATESPAESTPPESAPGEAAPAESAPATNP
jgi:hypothetical protein